MTDRLICPETGDDYCRTCGRSVGHWDGCPGLDAEDGTGAPDSGLSQHGASTAPLAGGQP